MKQTWKKACLAIVFSSCALLFAQDQAPNSEQRDRAVQRLTELQDRLQLTPDQKTQVVPILKDEFQQMRAVREEYGDPRDANVRTKLKMGRKVKSIRAASDKKLATVLTPTQMRELNKFREETKEEIKEARQQ